VSQAYEEDALPRLELVARAALPHFGRPGDSGVELLNLSENATYLVHAPDGGSPVVLRVGRVGYSSPREIESELAWMAAVREAGVLTPAVVPTTGGARFAMVATPAMPEPRACVMFEYCKGSEPTEDETAFERLGAVASQLHEHARRWARPRSFTRRTWDHATSVGATPHWGRWEDGMGVDAAERDLLGRLRDRLEDELAAYGKGPERFGLVHADMRIANLLFDGDDTWVIDFDDCGHSWFMYDLATALTFLEHRPEVPAWIAAWLRGYRRGGALSPDDVAIIPCLIMLRRLLVLAWIGSHANTDLARTEGLSYTQATCALAERHLAGATGWL
jgi:Ser/Thr protein kinase RdoA (MazF antagonist)